MRDEQLFFFLTKCKALEKYDRAKGEARAFVTAGRKCFDVFFFFAQFQRGLLCSVTSLTDPWPSIMPWRARAFFIID